MDLSFISIHFSILFRSRRAIFVVVRFLRWYQRISFQWLSVFALHLFRSTPIIYIFTSIILLQCICTVAKFRLCFRCIALLSVCLSTPHLPLTLSDWAIEFEAHKFSTHAHWCGGSIWPSLLFGSLFHLHSLDILPVRKSHKRNTTPWIKWKWIHHVRAAIHDLIHLHAEQYEPRIKRSTQTYNHLVGARQLWNVSPLGWTKRFCLYLKSRNNANK